MNAELRSIATSFRRAGDGRLALGVAREAVDVGITGEASARAVAAEGRAGLGVRTGVEADPAAGPISSPSPSLPHTMRCATVSPDFAIVLLPAAATAVHSAGLSLSLATMILKVKTQTYLVTLQGKDRDSSLDRPYRPEKPSGTIILTQDGIGRRDSQGRDPDIVTLHPG
ncbi:hypothetical protein THAOC_20985 [Thalassiosira oceanica]|uniref:Uncharacterized protein n=1 Tax=Thalassiosira oceanica TaxID=159749 RepID=K0S228_THAOC|nr:hypothetical protein THAOC_20985 [Thalassiosira oceanica]|eukprot:EJK58859.1 hypothetical protein THAOC_20985 [Thalassiosira oceanica]